ncbi:PREDICTED: RNA-directed DNA polymerase from mobile element jockey-like [Acropora digitifera]|uniref:RNA-directed DNA polymerase from mobile element jockey-like n=1 Tax=Acropora digitifera TaxID=70779 RepID=UPI00077A23DE|nr:PREDICTED: RNA-directed DNA polymerase from mobile element jockey-like [Acropora digitifera]
MAASIVAPSLTAVFTKSILTGIYPTEWKTARVTPVFKKGVKSDLNNYRPISVIPVVSKVFEKIVYDQQYQYLNDNKLLSSCQSGFHSLHSTLMALLEATNSWSVNIDNSFLNGVVFIDLKKAFGTIDHEIILRKLSYFDADQANIKWFQSYLSDRTQRCNVNGSLSTTSTVTCGVPQGNILGPFVFLMYLNDLPNCLRDAAPRMFADDTNITLSADLKLAVTSELNNFTCWLRANRLSLNVAKTELKIIGSRQRLHAQCDEIDICIDDKMIERAGHTKSLGLTIDAQLSWSKHVDEIWEKASSAIGALKRDMLYQFVNSLTAFGFRLS